MSLHEVDYRNDYLFVLKAYNFMSDAVLYAVLLVLSGNSSVQNPTETTTTSKAVRERPKSGPAGRMLQVRELNQSARS